MIFLAFFAGFAVYLHRTRFGRVLYAIGNNREAARFSGINVDRTLLGVFVASGAMCALAAIVLTAYLASARSDTRDRPRAAGDHRGGARRGEHLRRQRYAAAAY